MAKKILSTSPLEGFRNDRQRALTEAGYFVVSPANFRELEEACVNHKFDLAIIGHAFDPEVKRAIGVMLRDRCPTTPIVEMWAGDERHMGGADYISGPEVSDLLATVSGAFAMRKNSSG